MSRGDRTQRMRGWWARRSHETRPQRERPAGPGVGEALALLGELLDGAALPNGVIELVVEDPAAPVRHLFDIHDGRLAPLELGSALPWTSVSGTQAAWERALGANGDVSQLRRTGEPHLAERVLEELQRRSLLLPQSRS